MPTLSPAASLSADLLRGPVADAMAAASVNLPRPLADLATVCPASAEWRDVVAEALEASREVVDIRNAAAARALPRGYVDDPRRLAVQARYLAAHGAHRSLVWALEAQRHADAGDVAEACRADRIARATARQAERDAADG